MKQGRLSEAAMAEQAVGRMQGVRGAAGPGEKPLPHLAQSPPVFASTDANVCKLAPFNCVYFK